MKDNEFRDSAIFDEYVPRELDESGSVIDEHEPSPQSRAGVLGLVLVCAAALSIFYFKGAPQSASASPGAAPETNSTNDPVAVESSLLKQIREDMRETDKAVEEIQRLPNTPQVPLTDLKENPFRLGTSTTQVQDDAADAAANLRREQERQQALTALQSLHLQSVLKSDSRRACLINNTLFLEGQQIEGFVIQEITPTTVVVCRGVYRFELKAIR